MYCDKCGILLKEDSLFCPKCGNKVRYKEDEIDDSGIIDEETSGSNKREENTDCYEEDEKNKRNEIINKVSNYQNISGIVWIVIGGLQLIFGLHSYYSFSIIVGVINIVFGITRITYSKKIFSLKGRQIVSDFKSSIIGCVIAIVYNMIWGGVIGIAGACIDLHTRNYVLNNEYYILLDGEDKMF